MPFPNKGIATGACMKSMRDIVCDIIIILNPCGNAHTCMYSVYTNSGSTSTTCMGSIPCQMSPY